MNLDRFPLGVWETDNSGRDASDSAPEHEKQPMISLNQAEARVVRKLLDLYEAGRQHAASCECDHCDRHDAVGNLEAADFDSLENKVGWPEHVQTQAEWEAERADVLRDRMKDEAAELRLTKP